VSEHETIRLGQALKLAGVVSTGGEAKYLIQQGYVQVNGEVETRRKRQLHPGDTVTVGDQTFVIGLDDSPPPQDAGP
jgi:ribosome-associated protein